MNSTEMNDFSMIGLFKMEAESQCAVLTTGLLELEDNPSAADRIEPLMRAAHSLKGAARIVQLDPVVRVAHAMEDCFVAAGEGKLALAAEHIDKLLECVDCFKQLSACTESEIPAYLANNSNKLDELAKAFADIKNGNFKPVQSVTAPPAPDAPATEPAAAIPDAPAEKSAHPAHAEKSAVDKEAVVRIAADKMNRLMGLAAESLVGVKRLQGFEKKILHHKKRLLEIAALIDQMEQKAVDSDQFSDLKRILKDIQRKHNEYYRDYTEYFADFSDYSRTMDNFSDSLYREVISCRMRPFIEGVRDFPRSVRDLSRKLGKKISLEIIGESIAVDKDILDRLNAPLNHLVRNAVDHGIETPEERLKAGKVETGIVRLSARHWAGMLNISISDDGKGIDIEKIREKAVSKGLASAEIAVKLTEAELLEFMFLPGFSTAAAVTEISGRGVGLDVVQTMAQEVR
ncbi:MAG: Hpt domain-containing protein, partial [Lentisphaerota bacterium]